MPRTGDRDFLEDVKPQVGPIPASHPLPPASVGKDFFKVELLVGKDTSRSTKNHQLMVPFLQIHHQQAPLSLDYYMATPGLAFSIRVKLSRTATESALYGARVYVDSGKADKETVYKTWSDNDSDNNNIDDDETVDRSKADHYFWISAGQSEHMIEGFYKSETESQRFVFAEPSRKRKNQGEIVNVQEELHKVGTIRIMFCRVEGFEERSQGEIDRLHETTVNPRQAAIDELVDRKIEMAAKPGKIVKDGSSTGRTYAVLSKDIVYERRIVYNSFEGFNALGVTHQYNSQVNFYKGMPLQVLLDKTTRSRAITAFLRHLSSERIDLSQGQRLEQISGEPAAASRSTENNDDVDDNVAVVTANEFVRVEDIVHYICASLSPAASYIVCTGEEKTGPLKNYGERYVQAQRVKKEDRLVDFPAKERGLVAFFQTFPGHYELALDGSDPTKRNDKNYKVKLAVLEVDSDSDDE